MTSASRPAAARGAPSASFRSAPEQNTRPAPVSTITRAPGSVSALASAMRNCPTSAVDNALALPGELSVIVAQPPAVSERTSMAAWVAEAASSVMDLLVPVEVTAAAGCGAIGGDDGEHVSGVHLGPRADS